jgi:DNA polymerase-3 subunit gamma/tau
LLRRLAEGDGEGLMAEVGRLAEQSPDFAGVLAELNTLLQRLALAQQVPAALDDSMGDRAELLDLAAQMSPEQVQLYYQIGIIGRRDLPLAPDPRSGFEMVLLRMLAFRPASGAAASAGKPATAAAPRAATGAVQESRPEAPSPVQAMGSGAATAAPSADAQNAPKPEGGVAEPAPPQEAAPAPIDGAAAWAELVAKLPLTGMTRQLAEHTALLRHRGDVIELALDPGFENLRNPKWEEGLSRALEMYFGHKIVLRFESGEPEAATPQQLRKEQLAARQEAAEASIQSDPALQSILEQFGGEIEPGSIRPT